MRSQQPPVKVARGGKDRSRLTWSSWDSSSFPSDAVSSMSRALRMLLSLEAAILLARPLGTSFLSFPATSLTSSLISSVLGALTLTHTHLDRTGPITLDRFVHVKITLQVAEYFSSVLLRAC